MQAVLTGITSAMWENLSDGELVALYVKEQNQNAMRTLVNRHHDRLFSRFLGELKNAADAKDLEQQLWLQVHRNLPTYRDEGKFTHYLSRISSNLLNDYWRQKGRKAEVETANSDDDSACSSPDESANEEQRYISRELVDYLVSELIPQLPVEQRTAWLLRHESEFWEPGQQLSWSHLADLNGVEEATVWNQFETARHKLMTGYAASGADSLSGEETLVFTVWSQAQRLRKEQEFTWDYFSDLLGVSANTMKTRYRAAQKQLSTGLQERMQA